MSAAKYRDEDPATAFSMLLAHHVFHAPPALGVQVAMAKRRDARAAAGGAEGGGAREAYTSRGASSFYSAAGAADGKEEGD